ncbi:MAG TPA: YbaB/EbfC family nucleoid-associated protein [Candidatus Binataceae bacterium]|nr:YbaB/EbfC family nucleoid-associated protein [Candidatus Binataceae bacterium]
MADIDLEEMLKQAQGLQAKLQEMQNAAAERTVESQSGGGMVRVVVDGAMRVRKIEIDPAVVAAGDKPMLEDLIVAAVNDAMERAKQMVALEINKLNPLNKF